MRVFEIVFFKLSQKLGSPVRFPGRISDSDERRHREHHSATWKVRCFWRRRFWRIHIHLQKKKYPLPVSPDSEYFCSELTQVFSHFLFASSTGSSGPQGSRTCCLLLTKWQRFGNPTVCHWTPWPESPAFARSNMYPSDPELHIAIENGPRNS